MFFMANPRGLGGQEGTRAKEKNKRYHTRVSQWCCVLWIIVVESVGQQVYIIYDIPLLFSRAEHRPKKEVPFGSDAE